MESPRSSLYLIERIKKGDQEAFSPLIEKYRSRLAVWVHYRMSPNLRRMIEVDDILQETLLRAFKEFEHFQYRAPGGFMRWLMLIAEHVIADTARYHGREKRHAEMVRLRSESNPQGPEPADNRTPSLLLHEREKLQNLIRKLDWLPDHYREVILLSKVEGRSTPEMAEILGKTREATALLLHRALKEFRRIQASGSST
jgi:RNA polymerase sigma-70 factor (ECF subfamily)